MPLARSATAHASRAHPARYPFTTAGFDLISISAQHAAAAAARANSLRCPHHALHSERKNGQADVDPGGFKVETAIGNLRDYNPKLFNNLQGISGRMK